MAEVDGQRFPEYDARIGWIRVPENRATASGRSIEIAFIVIKSPNPRPGPPLFVLGAGPGGSGIREAQNTLVELPGLIDTFDIVGMDQRGLGRSRPNLDRRFSRRVEEPPSPAPLQAAYEDLIGQVLAYWSERGVDLAGYNTREAADDVEAIRAALGYERFNLFGFSYGSHLGLAVLRRHGQRVSRVALMAIEGPDHTFKTPQQMQAGLEAVAGLVHRDAGLRDQIPDLLRLVRRVLDRVEEDPVPVQIVDAEGVRHQTFVTGFAVREWIARQLGRRRGIAELPAALVAMDRGDYRPVAEWILAYRRTIAIPSAMGPATDCASGASEDRRARMREGEATTLLGHVADFPYPAACAAWNLPELDSSFRSPIRSAVPVLLIAGNLDARTPVGNAVEVSTGLSRSHVLVVENEGHDVYPSDYVVRFLIGEDVTASRIRSPPIVFAPIRPR